MANMDLIHSRKAPSNLRWPYRWGRILAAPLGMDQCIGVLYPALSGADPALASGVLNRDYHYSTDKFTKVKEFSFPNVMKLMTSWGTRVTGVDPPISLMVQRVVSVLLYYENENWWLARILLIQGKPLTSSNNHTGGDGAWPPPGGKCRGYFNNSARLTPQIWL